MAPAMDLPSIDFDQIKKLDILQTYWLLFEHMKNDFVVRGDFIKALTSNVVVGIASPPDYVLKGGVAIFSQAADVSIAETMNQAYQGLATTGGVAREQVLEGLSLLTS